MALEVINGPEELFSSRFEDDEEIMGACASGIIAPGKRVFTLNTDSPRGPYLGPHPKAHTMIMQKILGYKNVGDFTEYRVIRVTLRLIYSLESRNWKRQAIYECPKILTLDEFEEIKKEIECLQEKNVDVGGIVYDIDPRETFDQQRINALSRTWYGEKYDEEQSIECMLKYLKENIAREGYILPEIQGETAPKEGDEYR